MKSPEFTDLLAAALHNWSVGKPEDLKALAGNNTGVLKTHKGRGEIASYFVPALYIRELCQDLLAVGFPVEEIFANNAGDFLWLDWPEAVKHVAKYKPSLLHELAQEAFTEDTIGDVEPLGCFDPDDDENATILYDYWPRLIQEEVRANSVDFVNSSNEVWVERYQTAVSAVGKQSVINQKFSQRL